MKDHFLIKIDTQLLVFLLLFSTYIEAQVILSADGPGDTYELISGALAPGYKPIEAPGIKRKSCDNHSIFGDHISEVFDEELNKNVFKFVIHLNDDNDRCKKFDRQRNEIKAYKASPDSLKATLGETVEYSWKFKLDENFQASKRFTHLHQLKCVGGIIKKPIITLTARRGDPDKLELCHFSGTETSKLATVKLNLFRGKWVEVKETITFLDGNKGKYHIRIIDTKTKKEILDYSNNYIRMWATEAIFIRPKWGIYRSLKRSDQLRDENVLFADFRIEEKK
ncbi:hypothetical protein [Aquimarina pacifica]|uniref:hypothetical protein n=1 Tax=Aquimarina pacifica TaxID=1296415 RepID=UPI0004701097|nr:hypothetical protein [Aquimarina pacifica]